MRRTSHWKLLVASLFTVLFFVACERELTDAEVEQVTEEAQSRFTTQADANGISYCGTPHTSPMQIGSQTGSNYGTVTVGNDANYLYLTYSLDAANDYYLKEVQAYVGPLEYLPTGRNGNPQIGRFPFKQAFENCDLRKSVTFKVSLVDLDPKVIQDCINQCHVAMHAAVVKIPAGTDCASVTKTETSWGYGDQLVDGGSWAMGFQYCPDGTCSAAKAWCSMSQGYWFSKPNVQWTSDYVQFGDLKVYKNEGRALWPAKDNWVRKAFFQASALQLSVALNNNAPVSGTSIATEYSILCNFLKDLTYEQIRDGVYPAGTNVNEIQSATGKIGKWICENHCNSTEDPTACAGY